jgi:hypothetical protein
VMRQEDWDDEDQQRHRRNFGFLQPPNPRCGRGPTPTDTSRSTGSVRGPGSCCR